jgi:hypothetical protein
MKVGLGAVLGFFFQIEVMSFKYACIMGCSVRAFLEDKEWRIHRDYRLGDQKRHGVNKF